MATAKTAVQVSNIAKTRNARKPVAPVAPVMQLFVVVSESSKYALVAEAFDYQDADNLGKAGNNFDMSAINCIFAKSVTPTFLGYQEAVKANNKVAPVANRVKVPNSKTHNALFQRFNNVAKIAEAQELGFEALNYWNAKAITAKRETLPNLSYILKGARAFINGTKDEVTAEEKATKQLIALYKTMQDCKGKAWVLAEKQLTATMKGLGIELPEIADEEAEEE
jgi:hypothetical protein